MGRCLFFLPFPRSIFWFLDMIRGERGRMCRLVSLPPGSGDFSQKLATSTEEVNMSPLLIQFNISHLLIEYSSLFFSFSTCILLLLFLLLLLLLLVEQQQCQKRALSWVGAKRPHQYFTMNAIHPPSSSFVFLSILSNPDHSSFKQGTHCEHPLCQ